MLRAIVLLGLIGLSGCAGGSYLKHRGVKPKRVEAGGYLTDSRQSDSSPLSTTSTGLLSNITSVSDSSAERNGRVSLAAATTQSIRSTEMSTEASDNSVVEESETRSDEMAILSLTSLDLNLPSALAMIDRKHPAVGFAQWRVQEAYAQLDRAKALWLPSLGAGFSFHRHDGQLQASDSAILDVNRNSFQYGLGSGAVGAGTTPRPGLMAQFHLADAVFLPEVAEKTAWARGHAARGVVNEQLLAAALAYTNLLDAHQDLRIMQESLERTAQLSKLTLDFAEAGEGLQADADRLQTESFLVENRLIAAEERIVTASARLAETLSLEAGCQINPLDVVAVPLEMVLVESDTPSLIGTGLTHRPELKESQALVAAACEAHRRERYAPFVPSVLLGFSTSGFGGGQGSDLNNIDGRYDFDALMSWELRNLGFGEAAARRETAARVQQAKYEKIRVMDRVAREISESHSQVVFRRQQIQLTERAITSAEDSYQRNLERIRDGQGLPIEVLQSIQALESAQRSYLRSVVDYNNAQFRLQQAMGWPVESQ